MLLCELQAVIMQALSERQALYGTHVWRLMLQLSALLLLLPLLVMLPAGPAD
jgi:hypothetical protein